MKKIVLLHGWNYKNYSKYGCTDAWENRKGFVDALAAKFEVHKINLPGFCGAPEPKNSWNLDDFTTFLETYLNSHGLQPDYILGYSFGAAIALNWKNKLQKKAKLILVSPAIIRAYKKSATGKLSHFKKHLPRWLTLFFRDKYLKYLRNPYYTEGTRFLKETYLNIVKIDLTNELVDIQPQDVILIFGSEDTATPFYLLKNRLTNPLLLNRIKVIEGGGHDIANSHLTNIIHLIEKFDRNEN
ncbi:MAG: alpha/beta hydrolase [Mucilaginibacter sp.]|nr:alpha/beta hydrolase [Mucilaginibacter sp.]